MRENRKSGLMRGSNGIGDSRPLLSTLLFSVVSLFFLVPANGRAVSIGVNSASSSLPWLWFIVILLFE